THEPPRRLRAGGPENGRRARVRGAPPHARSGAERNCDYGFLTRRVGKAAAQRRVPTAFRYSRATRGHGALCAPLPTLQGYSPSNLFAFPPQIAATVFVSSDSVFATCPTGS